MFDEVRLAKPKVVGLDILFPEPQKTTWEPDFASTTRPVKDGTFVGKSHEVDHDKLAAVREHAILGELPRVG